MCNECFSAEEARWLACMMSGAAQMCCLQPQEASACSQSNQSAAVSARAARSVHLPQLHRRWPEHSQHRPSGLSAAQACRPPPQDRSSARRTSWNVHEVTRDPRVQLVLQWRTCSSTWQQSWWSSRSMRLSDDQSGRTIPGPHQGHAAGRTASVGVAGAEYSSASERDPGICDT